MQLINCNQERIHAVAPADESWEQSLEKAQDEIVLLREQIDSLQRYLSEQLCQQQEVEQELHCANQELGLMSAEVMQLVEAKWLFLEEIKEFVRTLSADGKISRRELTGLFCKFYDESLLEELELTRSNAVGAKTAPQPPILGEPDLKVPQNWGI